MDLPKPPDDQELKNIIDKLANFVARNGPEFENMTKQKQKDNPKFSFLFGGEHFNYYQYRVTTEQATYSGGAIDVINQQQKAVQLVQPPPWQPPPAAPVANPQMQQIQQQIEQQKLQQQIEQQKQLIEQQKQLIEQQKAEIQQKIKESETNLAAQYQSLIQQQQIQIEEGIMRAKEENLKKLCDETGISMEDLDAVTRPIIESCTKDAISNGKNWIFTHNTSKPHGDCVAQYLLKRITAKDGTFEMRLHLIYLMNDVLHHCTRKNAEELKQSIEAVVIPIFCSAHIGIDDDKKQKLEKLLNIWVNQKYFAPDIMEQMKDPSAAMATYQASLITDHASIVTQITTSIQQQYATLQKQHQEYCTHLNGQLSNPHLQLQQLEQLLQQQETAATAAPPPSLPPGLPPGVPPPGFDPSLPPPGLINQPPPGFPPIPNLNQAPPPAAPGLALPPTLDFSKPPPGFPAPTAAPPTDADLMPTVPYFDLPAGLMAPLVKLEDSNYKPLDPNDIRLPPPMPPSARLLAAVEAFYAPPTHENPRDGEGWEKLGLMEFFKAKQKSKKIIKKERARYRSRSRSRSRSRDRSRGRSRSRSRSRSPPRRRRRSYSRSPSPRRGGSTSPLPYQRRSASLSPVRRRGRSPSRSPTPPGFSFNEPFYAASRESRLGGENKGHQLLKKMGWGGAGLGASEQGRVDPVDAGEARDKIDMYKGIGVDMKDPFEQFRKSKSQGFIQRMKARDT